MLSSLRQQVFFSFFGLLLFAVLPWLLFVFYSPESIIKLGEIGYFEGGRFQHFPVNVLSQSTFNQIRLGYPIVLLVFGAITLAFFRNELIHIPDQFRRLIYKFRNFIRREFASLNRTEKLLAGITFLLLVTERSYYLLQFPIHTDEAATYLLFIRNGPFAIATFYPIPNNHLFQNLLAWPLTLLFSEPFWVLRLPPLLFSLLLSFFGFLILKRFSGFLIAYFAVSLFSFGSLTLFLSTQGRGYILLTLLAVLAMGCLFKALQTNRVTFWVAFSFVSALGFYAVPTFAYPFVACLTFAGLYLVFQRNWKSFPNLILAAAVTLMAFIILYSPLLLVSGPDPLLENNYLLPLTPAEFAARFPMYLREVQGELMGDKFGIGIWAFYISTGVLILLFIFQNRPVIRKWLPGQTNWLIGFCLVTSAVLYGLLRFQLLLPPPRVVFYKSFSDYVGLAIVISVMLQLIFRKVKLQRTVAFMVILSLAFFQIQATVFFLKDYPQPYYTSPALNKQIRESGAQRVYVEEAFYQLFLEYDYARFGKSIKIENEVNESESVYDYVVLEHQKQFPAAIPDSLYQQVYEDALVKAYRPKNKTGK